MCCEENKLKLIPVVILVAALIAGLLIAFVPVITPLFPFVLAVSLLVLTVTGILVAVCGLRRPTREEGERRLRSSATCACVRCFAPIVLISSFISLIFSLIAIPNFSITPLINTILGIIFAIVFSTAIVYFLGMFLCILDEDECR